MISLDKARTIVLKEARPLPPEILPAGGVAGAVLAEQIIAPHPIPRFDASAVDGYAVRTEDLAEHAGSAVRLRVGGIQRAGDTRARSVHRGETIRVLTGALIPRGADAVIMQEDAVRSGSSVSFSVLPPAGGNIRPAGAEFHRGAVMLPRGSRITPPAAGLLATAGRRAVRVHRRPRVAVVVTGDELRGPGEKLKAGQIRDSNGPALLAGLERLRTTVVSQTRAGDSVRALRPALSRALRVADVVVVAGGVSVGDYDLVRGVLTDLGVKERFWRIAVKPGKPVSFGTRGRTLVFGLPGNPVGALLMFDLLVAPAIRRMGGQAVRPQGVIRATLSAPLRKRTERLELVRAVLTDRPGGRPVAVPVRSQESHMLGGLAAANAVVLFPPEQRSIRRGAVVNVLPLSWSAEE